MRYCTRCFSIIDEDSDHCEHCAAGDSLTGKIISQTFVLAVLLGIALFVTNLLLGIIYSVSNDNIDYLHEQNSKNNETYQLTEMYW